MLFEGEIVESIDLGTDEKRELIYANQKVFDIYGCADLEEFKELTGYTFEGMVYPEDFEKIQSMIDAQIDDEEGDSMDHVQYRIIRKDGQIRWVDDFGHFSHSPEYGDVYYVFISDITEKRAMLKQGDRYGKLAGMIKDLLDDIERNDLQMDDRLKEDIIGIRQEIEDTK